MNDVFFSFCFLLLFFFYSTRLNSNFLDSSVYIIKQERGKEKRVAAKEKTGRGIYKGDGQSWSVSNIRISCQTKVIGGDGV